MRIDRRLPGVAALACAAALAACSPRQTAPAPAAVANPEQQFTALERRYVIFVLGRFPVVATYLGGSEFDAALAAGASTGRSRG